jgi:ABC-type branched-subunit amino acid transport system ATPase component
VSAELRLEPAGVRGERRRGSLPEAVAAGAGWGPLLLLGALAGGVLAQGAVLLLAQAVAASHGRSVESTGRLLGLWCVGVVLGAPFALRWCLRERLVACASRGGALMGLGLAVVALSSGAGELALGAVVSGAGAVLAAAPLRALLGGLYPPLALTHALVAWRALALLVGASALVLSGPVVAGTALTWRAALLVLAAAVTAVACLVALLDEPGSGAFEREHVRRRLGAEDAEVEASPVPGFGESVRRLLAVPSVRPLLGAVAVVTAVGYGTVVFGGYALAQRSGLGAQAVTWVLVVAAAVAAAAALDLAGRTAGDWRDAPAQLARTGCQALGVVAVAVVVLGVSTQPVVSAAALVVAASALGVTAGVLDRLVVVVVPVVLRGASGVVTAAYAGALGVGLGGSLLAGLEGSGGTPTALSALGGSALAGLVALRSVGRSAAADVASTVGGIVESVESAAARASGARAPLLSCRRVSFSYGPLQILFDVDFSVDEGEMVALLGTNGAGKSTLLRVISGLGLPSSGTVRLSGQDITYAEPGERVRLGVSQIPGGKAVFGPLSVVDNLRLYGYALGRDRRAVDRGIEESFATFPRLAERRNSPASTMSGGEQQMLALSKALILQPRLLLIDELSLGLAPKVVGELLALVRSINAKGTSVVLVEQSVNVALSLAEHAYFMEKGQVRFDGRTEDLLARPDILRSVFLSGAASQEARS